MKPLLILSNDKIIETYERFRTTLKGNDMVMFEAMRECTKSLPNAFQLPSNIDEYEKKHQEIINKLKLGDIIGFGFDQAIRLVIEILKIAKFSSGIPGVNINDLYSIACFQTAYKNIKLRITKKLSLCAEWEVEVYSLGVRETYNINVDLYNDEIDEIVPDYVFEYINGAIIAYNNQLYAVSSVLISIATEVTLRDTLISKGYEYSYGKKNTSGKKNVTGLGVALSIARNDEGFLTPDIIPIDLDKVLTTIRNNLVHLSKDSLLVPIEGTNQNLIDFISNPNKVFALLSYITPFITKQYNDLIKANAV